MTELKNCPFCGGKAISVQIPNNTEAEMWLHPSWEWRHPGQWIVGCETDMCLGYYGHITMVFPDKKNAVKAWNRRSDNE